MSSPLGEYLGDSDTAPVWMFFAATPAALIPPITFRISVPLAFSAPAAVLPWLVTPNENATRLGTAVADPDPVTVTERVVAEPAVPAAPATPGPSGPIRASTAAIATASAGMHVRFIVFLLRCIPV